MNINCTNKCKHQRDGKCTLSKIENDYHLYNVIKKSDCPYISEEINKITKY